MSRLTAMAMVLALSFITHAETTSQALVDSMIKVSQQTLQVTGAPGWSVGDRADYKLDMGFIKGTMQSHVREETDRGYWMVQDMDLGQFGNQKVEILLDKGTFQIIEMRVNGQQQDPPTQNVEVIETREEKVTVPAGTFEAYYIRVKNKDNGDITQSWVNPQLVPMSGMIKTIAPGQFGEVKVDMTSFERQVAPFFAARNPVGETATYGLDRSRARTTNMIRKGKLVAKVTGRVGSDYNVKLDYDLTVSWVGRQRGSREMAAPARFFDPAFMVRLRREKTVVLPQFRVRHRGYADARVGNTVYNNTDVILIDNVQIESLQDPGFMQFVGEILASSVANFSATNEQIENLKILAHVDENTPVLGAVKIDLSGKARGFNFKAGFDIK